jgi:hypothetical protein
MSLLWNAFAESGDLGGSSMLWVELMEVPSDTSSALKELSRSSW